MRSAAWLLLFVLLLGCGQSSRAERLHLDLLPNVLETEHFVLRSDLPTEQLGFHRDVLAGFWTWFEAA